jgi:hypothetical protein
MRNLGNMSYEDAQRSGWEILKDLDCEVIGKAVFNDKPLSINIMKSTKRFKVPGGWIYNTSVEYHKQDKVAIAEALVFVPTDNINK